MIKHFKTSVKLSLRLVLCKLSVLTLEGKQLIFLVSVGFTFSLVVRASRLKAKPTSLKVSRDSNFYKRSDFEEAFQRRILSYHIELCHIYPLKIEDLALRTLKEFL